MLTVHAAATLQLSLYCIGNNKRVICKHRQSTAHHLDPSVHRKTYKMLEQAKSEIVECKNKKVLLTASRNVIAYACEDLQKFEAKQAAAQNLFQVRCLHVLLVQPVPQFCSVLVTHCCLVLYI